MYSKSAMFGAIKQLAHERDNFIKRSNLDNSSKAKVYNTWNNSVNELIKDYLRSGGKRNVTVYQKNNI